MLRPCSLPLVASLILAVLLLGSCDDTADDRAATKLAPTTTTVETTTTTAVETTTTSTTEAPTTTTTAVPSIVWEYTTPADLPVVTVLDPGQQPLEELLYTMEVGVTDTMIMRNRLAIEQSIDGEQTLDLATDIATEATVTVLAIDEAGITVQSTFGSSTVETADPLTRAATEAAYGQLEGLTTYSLVSPRGEVLGQSTAELPTELGDLVQGFAGTTAPLPHEPIGEGAEWEVVGTVASAGMTVVQTSRFRLLEIDGPLLTVETTTAQSLGPDGLAVPGIETVDVDLVTSGSGTATWDLTGPIPIKAFSTADQTLKAELAVGEQKAALDQSVSMSLLLARAPGPGLFDLWDVGELQLVGDAERFVSHLRVTPSKNRLQAGAAWLITKQPVADAFETSFRFRISGVEQNPGDGFAFVIQNSSAFALGTDSYGIGYNDIPRSVAVEFDTTLQEYSGDPGSQHLGVHTRGMASNSSHESASLGSTIPPVVFADGETHRVTIKYSPGTLLVFLDDPDTPVLSVEIDIADAVRLDDGTAWIGFTASTEPGFRENHDILDWTFSPQS